MFSYFHENAILRPMTRVKTVELNFQERDFVYWSCFGENCPFPHFPIFALKQRIPAQGRRTAAAFEFDSHSRRFEEPQRGLTSHG